jgi:hypothetical protein
VKGFTAEYQPGRYAAILTAAGLGAGVMIAVASAGQAASAPATSAQATSAQAVADDVTSVGASMMLAERWNGTAWTILTTPRP